MQRMGSSIFSNLYPFVALDLDALRVNQTTASPVSPLFVGNLCAFLFNLNMLGIHQDTVGLVKLLLSYVSTNHRWIVISSSPRFLDVRPLESKMNSNVTPNEYRRFLDQMFYMYTKIAQYLRLIFESTSETLNESVTNDHLVQLIALLSYFPENQLDQSENFWQSKIHLAHFLTNILLQQSSSLHQIINQTIVQHAAALFSNAFLVHFLISPSLSQIFCRSRCRRWSMARSVPLFRSFCNCCPFPSLNVHWIKRRRFGKTSLIDRPNDTARRSSINCWSSTRIDWIRNRTILWN